MKFKKIMVALVSVLLLSALFAGCGSGENAQVAPEDQTYVFKFAHEEAPDSFQDVYAHKFAELLNEKTDGKAQVEIFTIGQLGTDQDMLEALQTGAVDFAISSPGCAGTILPEAQFVNLHFLFSDDMNVNKEVLNSSDAFYKHLAGVYEKKGIKVFDFWTEGFMDWTSNRPLQSLEDFKGFKIRTMQTPLIVASYEAYDASPTPLPFSEVYSSLQLNMIDGQENPIEYIQHNNLHEVQDYITISNHALYVTSTVANPKTFDALPQDIQDAVLETIEELKDFSFQMVQERNDKALEIMQSESDIQAVEISPEDRAAFVEASKALRQQYIDEVGEIGQTIIDTLVADIEAAENK